MIEMRLKGFLAALALAALAGCGGGGGDSASTGNVPGGAGSPGSTAPSSGNASYTLFKPDLSETQVAATVAASSVAIESTTVSTTDAYVSASFSGAFNSGVALAGAKLLMLCSSNTDTSTHVALASEAVRVTAFTDLAGLKFKVSDCRLKDLQNTTTPSVWEFDAAGTLKIRNLTYATSARDAIFSEAGLTTNTLGGTFRARAYRIGAQYFLVFLNDDPPTAPKKFVQIGVPQ